MSDKLGLDIPAQSNIVFSLSSDNVKNVPAPNTLRIPQNNTIIPTLENGCVIQSGSFYFDGVNDYIDCGNVLNFERTDSFSVSTWVNLDVTTGNGFIIAKEDSTSASRGWGIASSNGQISLILRNNQATLNRLFIYLTTPLQVSNWYHVTVTYNGSSSASGVKIYVNGVSESLTTLTDNLSGTIQNSVPLFIGARDIGNPSYFNGKIDEPTIWNKELSQQEVTQLYNALKDKY